VIGAFLAAAVLLVAFGGLMAAADAALGSLGRTELVDLAAHSRRPSRLLAIADDPGAHANAVNFMRIVAETTAAVLVTLVFVDLLETWWAALLVSALIMIATSFVLVGSSPRSVGRVHARSIMPFTAPLVRSVRIVLGPIPGALVAIGNRVTPGRPRSATFSSEEQLLSMVDEATELDVLEEGDRELIHSIFEFNDTVVRAVMVPRTDMITIDHDADTTAAMSLFLGTGVSRVPVVGENVDEVLGVLYLRDVSRVLHEGGHGWADATARSLARPAVFVPESQKVDSLLRQMQLQSNHLAMVVDEYGGIAGLVTMEDIIEELVGDISDEYDRAVAEVEDLGEGRFRVSARLAVDELGDLFGLELEDDDVETVGGLLAKTLGSIPLRGATARVSGLVLVAERVEGRRKRISTVLVERDTSLADVQSASGGEQEER